MSKDTVKYLKIAEEIQNKKGQDYQNPDSIVRQADYYPRGVETILDIMQGKVLRIRSVLEAKNNPNFESLEDSAIDLINYATFFLAYMNGEIDGQDPNRDHLNRPINLLDDNTRYPLDTIPDHIYRNNHGE